MLFNIVQYSMLKLNQNEILIHPKLKCRITNKTCKDFLVNLTLIKRVVKFCWECLELELQSCPQGGSVEGSCVGFSALFYLPV